VYVKNASWKTEAQSHRSQHDDEMVARFTCSVGIVWFGNCDRLHATVDLNYGIFTPRTLYTVTTLNFNPPPRTNALTLVPKQDAAVVK
jgi:hypothetical protein